MNVVNLFLYISLLLLARTSPYSKFM